MRQRRTFISLFVIAGFALLYFVALVPTAKTYPPFLKKAQELGYKAKDCTFCHVNATGGEPYNDRGKWLIAEKQKRGANAVDVSWLKDYKPAAKKGTKKTDTHR
jgi:hypothetical protein